MQFVVKFFPFCKIAAKEKSGSVEPLFTFILFYFFFFGFGAGSSS